MFVRSEDMIADIGTQHVSDLDVVGKDSVWIIRWFDWMKWDKASFPAKQLIINYKFPKYVVDPNKARFKKVVGIFAFVLRLFKKLQMK